MDKQFQGYSSRESSTKGGGVGGTWVEINGRQWKGARDAGGRGRAMRAVAPGERPSGDADVTTPHPDEEMREAGWRMEWIFFAVIMVVGLGLCVGAGVLTSVATGG